MKRLVLPFCALCASCQLVNEPDLSFLDGDADSDSDTDTDTVTDGVCEGIDCGGHGTCIEKTPDVAGCECETGYIEAPGPTCVIEPVEVCEGGTDEDDDGFVDCADFDCLGDDLCCGGTKSAPDPIVEEDFADGFDGEWELFEPARLTPASTPLGLRDMGDYPEGNGIRFVSPVDFSGGVEIQIRGSSGVEPKGGSGDCTSIAGCTDYIGVALTRVITFVEGVPFPTSFAVYVAPSGQVLVTRGGVVRARGTVDRVFDLRVRLTPAISEGQSGFAAEVTSVDGEDEETLYVTTTPLLLPEDNLRVDGSTGATFAILGRTANPSPGIVIFDDVTVTPLQCANPSAWTQTDTVGDAVSIGAGPWAEGSFGAPTAVLEPNDEVRLLYDGSNLDPFFEIYGDVNRSVGEASFATDTETFTPVGLVIGEDPPNCIGGSCPDPPSQHYDARGPGLYKDGTNTRSVVVEAGGEEVWSYGFDTSWTTGSDPIFVAAIEGFDYFTSAAAVVRTGDSPEVCVFVVGVGDELPGDVYATCGANLSSLQPIAKTPTLAASDLGAVAAGGIQTVSVTFDEGPTSDPADDLFRLWSVVEDASGATSIAHALVGGTLDARQAYAGNPVLRPDSSFLDPCEGDCRFTGVGLVEDGALRRFFLGRRDDAEATTFEILAARQLLGGT